MIFQITTSHSLFQRSLFFIRLVPKDSFHSPLFFLLTYPAKKKKKEKGNTIVHRQTKTSSFAFQFLIIMYIRFNLANIILYLSRIAGYQIIQVHQDLILPLPFLDIRSGEGIKSGLKV